MCADEGNQSWRVFAEGSDSLVRDADDSLWGRVETVVGHRWVEQVAPLSGLCVTRGRVPGERDDVWAEVTVRAADEAGARARAQTLFEGAMPSVTFGGFRAEPLTAAHVAEYRATPVRPTSAEARET